MVGRCRLGAGPRSRLPLLRLALLPPSSGLRCSKGECHRRRAGHFVGDASSDFSDMTFGSAQGHRLSRCCTPLHQLGHKCRNPDSPEYPLLSSSCLARWQALTPPHFAHDRWRMPLSSPSARLLSRSPLLTSCSSAFSAWSCSLRLSWSTQCCRSAVVLALSPSLLYLHTGGGHDSRSAAGRDAPGRQSWASNPWLWRTAGKAGRPCTRALVCQRPCPRGLLQAAHKLHGPSEPRPQTGRKAEDTRLQLTPGVDGLRAARLPTNWQAAATAQGPPDTLDAGEAERVAGGKHNGADGAQVGGDLEAQAASRVTHPRIWLFLPGEPAAEGARGGCWEGPARGGCSAAVQPHWAPLA